MNLSHPDPMVERRLAALQRYMRWLESDEGSLPGKLEDCCLSMDFVTQVAVIDDLVKAISDYLVKTRSEGSKGFHGETPKPLSEVVLLNLSPKELYFVHHLMALGVLAMGGEEAFILLALAQAKAGLKSLGTEDAVSLFDRVNRLSLASFPDAMVIHLSKEEV